MGVWVTSVPIDGGEMGERIREDPMGTFMVVTFMAVTGALLVAETARPNSPPLPDHECPQCTQ